MPGITIPRNDYTSVQLRAAARSRDSNAARPMLALAFVLEGESRSEAAASCGIDRQALRDWVHRYNAFGLDGLIDQQAPGASPRLSPSRMQEVAELVRRGPDPAVDGVVRWRRIDLSRLIEERWGVPLAERSVGDLQRLLAAPRAPARQ